MAAKEAKVILFFSSQGGSGKTTMAADCALFAQSMGYKALVLDMAPFGSIISKLRITGREKDGLSSIITSFDLELENKKLDYIELINNYINIDQETGLSVLSHFNPIKVEAIKSSYIKLILSVLRRMDFDFIFIDTSAELNVRNIILIEGSDRVVVPIIQDVTCGWKILQMEMIFGKYNLNLSKFGMVINMCNKHSGFNNDEFQTECKCKVISEIALFPKNFQAYINRGYPIIKGFNKKAYNEFKELTQTILNFCYT